MPNTFQGSFIYKYGNFSVKRLFFTQDIFFGSLCMYQMDDPLWNISKISLLKIWFVNRLISVNPFSTNVPFLYPLKTSENRRFSDVFRGYRKKPVTRNRLKASRQFKYLFGVSLLLPSRKSKLCFNIFIVGSW